MVNAVPRPISEAPHDTGLSGFVNVSKDIDRRDSVRNFEWIHVRPILFPRSLSETQPIPKTERFCPMEQSGLAKRAALPPPLRWLARLPEKKGRARPLQAGWGGVTRPGMVHRKLWRGKLRGGFADGLRAVVAGISPEDAPGAGPLPGCVATLSHGGC